MEEQKKSFRNEFYEKFRTVCVPILEGFEKERKIYFYITIFLFIMPVLALIGGGIHAFFVYAPAGTTNLSTIDFSSAWTAGIIALIISTLLITVIKKFFENKVKEKVMPILCQCFGRLTWSYGQYSSADILRRVGLIESYSKYYVDDVFTGSVEDVPLEIAEVKYTKIVHDVDSEGRSRTRERTIWDGVLVQFKMNKSFTGHTIVKPDSLVKLSGDFKLHHTTLEDVVFEKKFDVYTDDDVEARYLLTTAFMERLTKVKTAFGSGKISCAFYQDKLILGIETNKDLFSVASVFKPVSDEKQFFTMFEEINSLVKLIDHFKLNQKIGL